MINSFEITIKRNEKLKEELYSRISDLFRGIPGFDLKSSAVKFDKEDAYLLFSTFPISRELAHIKDKLMNFVKNLVKIYGEDILHVLVKMDLPYENGLLYLQISYNPENNKHAIDNFGHLKVFYKEIVRDKALIVAIDKTKSPSDLKYGSRVEYIVNFKSKKGGKPIELLVLVNRFYTKENEEYSIVKMGPRFQHIYSFVAGVPSWRGPNIIEAIKSKLDERGYDFISINKAEE